MNKTTKRTIAKYGSLAVALTLATTLGASSLTAFAANDKARTDDVTSEYESFNEVLKAEEKLNLDLAAEGFVLLKNENKALPLAKNAKVTLLGKNAYSLQDGGGGSGAASRPGNASQHIGDWISQGVITFDQGVDNALQVNPDVKKATTAAGANAENGNYMTLAEEGNGAVTLGSKKYDVNASNDYAAVENTFETYGDAAIINIMRSGSEFSDNAVHGVQNHADVNEHYQTLNDSERQLLAYAKYQKAQGKFKKIIVSINSPSPMEIADIQEDEAFDSIIWIGTPGWNGAEVIGDFLTGEINPSGHIVDIWMKDIKTDPTYYNFGTYEGATYAVTGGQTYDHTTLTSGASLIGAKGTPNPSMNWDEESAVKPSNAVISYSEGIFMGYRYYETVAADLNAKTAKSGDTWYDANVIYPFGYGLSYTTFTQEITKIEGDLSSAAGNITVTVKVTNTGSVAGKDVVEVYSTPPYTKGGIDKAEVNLVDFAKTGTIQPGASEDVEITFAVKDLASFDYNDKNKNNYSGYEVEAGKYVISIRSDSHTVLDSEELEHTGTSLQWDEDGNEETPNNIFSQTEGKWEPFNTSASHWTESGIDHDLHRDALLNDAGTAPSDLKTLVWLVGATNDNAFTTEAANVFNAKNFNAGMDYDNFTTSTTETDYANLWVKTKDDMTGLTQGTGVADKTTGLYPLTMESVYGKDYDDEAWDKLLNQLTWTELVQFVSAGGYQNVAIPSIGKPRVTDQDGPGQLKANGICGWFWVGETVIAATWNVELARKEGNLVGEEEIWNSGAGWYGPAMNTHRTPLSGRNFEYYSQDGVQGGKIAAAVVGGCVEVGGKVYIKHAFLNDQEAGRMNGLATFCNEQAIREIYAKPFELAIKEGHANGIMSAFNNIGLMSSASYALNVQLYTNEWGYRGATVTDFYQGNLATGWTGAGMVRGLQFPLGNATGNNAIAGTWDSEKNAVVIDEKENYTQWYWTRETAKRLLFVYVNSAAYAGGFIASQAAGETTAVTGTVGTALTAEGFFNTDYLDEFFGEGQYTFSANLPTGLTIDPDTGVISGTPIVMTSSIVRQGRNNVVVNYQDITITVSGKEEGKTFIGASVTVRFTITDPLVADLQQKLADLQEKLDQLQGTAGPEGPAGADGKSAYELWLEQPGNEGKSIDDFYAFLKGEKGDKGDKGEKGDTGAAGAKGEKGDTGATGPAGPAGADGKDAEGGCGGVIGLGAAAVATITILGGAVLVMKRKND